MIDYVLVRSKRRSISIYVRDGGVEVRAPFGASKRNIDNFVSSKEYWITGKLAELSRQSEIKAGFSLDYGDKILLRGTPRAITGKNVLRAESDGESFYIPPDLPPGQIKSVCVQLYHEIARTYLSARTAFFAARMGVSPASVRVGGAKTLWGSCSAKKNIRFSWRLVMADDDVIDYVVVHELAHLVEMNHSYRFWEVVGDVLPDHMARRARLRALQRKLKTEDWD